MFSWRRDCVAYAGHPSWHLVAPLCGALSFARFRLGLFRRRMRVVAMETAAAWVPKVGNLCPRRRPGPRCLGISRPPWLSPLGGFPWFPPVVAFPWLACLGRLALLGCHWLALLGGFPLLGWLARLALLVWLALFGWLAFDWLACLAWPTCRIV